MVLGALVALLLTGCSVLKAATAPPLPPAETLGLEVRLLPGEASFANRTARLTWTPPGSGVEKVVLEQAESPNGPWQEIKVVYATRGFHEETSLFRPNRFYYFRASLLRGKERSLPTPPIELWVPSLAPTPTPAPTPPPTPTPPGG